MDDMVSFRSVMTYVNLRAVKDVYGSKRPQSLIEETRHFSPKENRLSAEWKRGGKTLVVEVSEWSMRCYRRTNQSCSEPIELNTYNDITSHLVWLHS